jgi:hypothetical protein
VLHGHHAYVGHQNGPEGTTILDVSDPRKSKIVARLMVPKKLTHTHKVRVVGDLMGHEFRTPARLRPPQRI